MLADKQSPDSTTPRRYLVTCEGCSFERSADGRDDAAEIGSAHRRETRHEVVAMEVPPSMEWTDD